MRAAEYFESHPVFRHEDFVAAHTRGGRSRATSNNLLARHVASGRLLRVRRGVYATVRRGHDRRQLPADPFLVACQLSGDAVVAYHAALEVHGRAYSVWHRIHYLTGRRAARFRFQGTELAPVVAPAAVRGLPDFGGGVESLGYADGEVRVTTLERTMVDVLDSPGRCGGWEEVWRCLEMVEYFELDAVIDYALKLDSALTIARVGFYLGQHRESLMVDDATLDELGRHVPRQPRYFDVSRQPGRLVKPWNLIVPHTVLQKSWEGEW